MSKSERPFHAQSIATPKHDDGDQILTFQQWCRLDSISERSGRRILNAPNGPVVVQLSTRRIGISRRANRAWLASRERGVVASGRSCAKRHRKHQERGVKYEPD